MGKDGTRCDSPIVDFSMQQCVLDSGVQTISSPDVFKHREGTDFVLCFSMPERQDVLFFRGGAEGVNEMSSMCEIKEICEDDAYEFSERVLKIGLRLILSGPILLT